MRWIRISKGEDELNKTVGYQRRKPALCIESRQRCVYCRVHDARLGGMRSFHVEHFRPKVLFPQLTNSYANLFYACPVCNVLKSDDWPDNTDPHYLDPSEVDLAQVLVVKADGCVAGLGANADYMVQRLCLNRTQLLAERRYSQVDDALRNLTRLAEEYLAARVPQDSAGIEFLGGLLALQELARAWLSKASPT